MEIEFANGAKLDCNPISIDSQEGMWKYHRYTANHWRTTIKEAYRRPSPSKIEAYQSILEEMGKVDGWGQRITGANTYLFSIAYKAETAKGDIAIVYHSKKGRSIIILPVRYA